MIFTTSRTNKSSTGRSGGIRNAAFLPLLIVLSAAAPAQTAETAAARAVVDQTVSDVLLVLNDAELTSGERRRRIEAVALERFDFDTMARLVLARSWRRLSAEQRTEFVTEFKNHLSANYGSRIERYKQESVDVVGERLEPRGDVTVKTRMVGGEADGIEVQYRLRGGDASWRIIDVVIEGVSLVSSFRAQFAEVLSRDGPEKLIDRLRDKNERDQVTPPSSDEGGPDQAPANPTGEIAAEVAPAA